MKVFDAPEEEDKNKRQKTKDSKPDIDDLKNKFLKKKK